MAEPIFEALRELCEAITELGGRGGTAELSLRVIRATNEAKGLLHVHPSDDERAEPPAPAPVADHLRSATEAAALLRQPAHHDLTTIAPLLWLLWHHQGARSSIGQPIRRYLGIGQFERLTPEQITAASQYQGLAPVEPHLLVPVAERSWEREGLAQWLDELGHRYADLHSPSFPRISQHRRCRKARPSASNP